MPDFTKMGRGFGTAAAVVHNATFYMAVIEEYGTGIVSIQVHTLLDGLQSNGYG